MEGFWTFLVSETQSGGVLMARDGKLYGGDECYYFQGTYTAEEDQVTMSLDINLYNPEGLFVRPWGDSAEQFALAFAGSRTGDSIKGTIRRPGMEPAMTITLTRRLEIA